MTRGSLAGEMEAIMNCMAIRHTAPHCGTSGISNAPARKNREITT